MAGATFLQQLRAFLKRNFLLKRRNLKNTVQEFFFPIYFVVILALIRLAIAPRAEPAIPSFKEQSLLQPAFQVPANNHFLVTPNSSTVRQIMDDLVRELNITASPAYKVYDTEAEAENAYTQDKTNVVAGINFDAGILNHSMSYTLRLPYNQIPLSYNKYGANGNCRTPGSNNLYLESCPANQYLGSKFSIVQLILDTVLIRRFSGQANFPVPDMSVQMLPKAAFRPEVQWFQILASIYFIFAYTPFISILTLLLVTEKEKKIKEAMKLMGMRDSAFWMSWGIIYFFIIALVTALVIFIAWIAKFFVHSNMLIPYLMLFLYGLTTINLAFLFSPFFSKARTAAAFSSLSTMLVSLLFLVVALTRVPNADGIMESSLPVWAQWLLCLLSPVAVSMAMYQGIYLDVAGVGMTFETIKLGKFPLYAPLIMLAVDFVLYGLLAAYFDNIVPGEYGLRRPAYFCFLPSYWCTPKEKTHISEGYDNLAASMQGDGSAYAGINDPDREPVSQDLKGFDVVRLFNLRKIFKQRGKEDVVAVKDISLDLYEGQITALLGHNGAGKTTLMNMLTGMSPPTSGCATIFGLDVSNHLDLTQLRQVTGYCPQHNILFPDLTCREHLDLFANIKGVKPENIETEIEKALQDVDLMDKIDTISSQLSGGQMRKLSVAIALIGDPKIIFLDEPTAGMDPYSRRHLWTLLKERRPGRVILLSTHFMDEADILADRKAFISKGTIQCVGSSLFLKNKFGLGYHLSMVVDEGCDADAITSLVRRHVETAEIKRRIGKELIYTLPLEAISQFSGLFADLERPDAELLGVKGFGVSMTSLEEVFLKLEDEEAAGDIVNETETNDTHNNPDNNATNDNATDNVNSTSVNIGFSNGSNECSFQQSGPKGYVQKPRWQQFKALAKIRIKILTRSIPSLIFRLIYPCVLATGGIALQRFGVRTTLQRVTDNEVTLNSSLYSATWGQSPSNPAMIYSLTPGGANGSQFIAALNSSGIVMDQINATTDLLAYAPHFMGVNVSDVSTVGGVLKSSLTSMYNDTATHSLPTTMNAIMNGLLTMVANPPEPLTLLRKAWPGVPRVQLNMGSFGAVTLLALPVTFIPSLFAGEVVRDRENKLRGLLRISGVDINTYWGSTFAVDFVQFCIVSFYTIIVAFAFGIKQLLFAGAAFSFIVLYLLYMPLTMFMNYLISFGFNKSETAYSVMPNVLTYIGFIPFILMSILDIYSNSNAGVILHYVFTVIDPVYIIFGGIYFILKVYHVESTIQQTTSPNIPFTAYFDWNNHVAISLLMPLLHSIWIYFAMRYAEVKKTGGDSRDVIGCCGSGGFTTQGEGNTVNNDVIQNEEDDVANEREKITNMSKAEAETEGVVVTVRNLRKEFSTQTGGCCGKKNKEKIKVAVRNNTFGVKAGEVFGLLGPNGAGKSTTLNMIIAEEGPTAGQVNVAGYDIHSSLSAAFKNMGYCPQHDSVWELITLREHLECFGLIKGLHPDDVKVISDRFIKSLQLEDHANKKAKELSGGTKRKLCYGIALLADPKVVLLDEPSTGMDPKSKRYFWDTISANFNNNERGAILTTHYMEEADALCTRVAIMVNGQVECLGSTQHLKAKYGSGYVLEIKLDTAIAGDLEARISGLHSHVLTLFSTADRVESFAERVTYNIPQKSVASLSSVFGSLEEAKTNFGIEEYSFSQSTLEQVFLRFAKKQWDEDSEGNAKTSPSHNQVDPQVTIAT